ncbi:hypothetical protein DFH09DRAFT_1472946 [Mycena vulgaris]|nr:hypothetical protein DFH09DRAFT_1472946 [Mycena vulgaris]
MGGNRQKSALPPISWTKDGGALIWKLLAEVEKPDHRPVILGKKDNSENTSGISKAAAFTVVHGTIRHCLPTITKAIGKEILPDAYGIDADAVAKCVKLKYEDIYGTYKKHAKQLRDTGGGLGGNDNNDKSLHEYMSCYIPNNGPDATTTQDAKNLWDQITKEFPFFPTFHRLYSTRPNVNPPVIITGVGPAGRKIVHLQAPNESQGFPNELIDPSLFNLRATPPKADDRSSSPFSDWNQTPTKPATLSKVKSEAAANLSAAILKARQNLKQVPAKRSFEDTLVSLHEKTIEQAAHRAALQDNVALRRLMLDEKAQLIEMQKLGIYSKEEILVMLAEVEERFKVATQPKPAKRARLPCSDSLSSDIEIISP